MSQSCQGGNSSSSIQMTVMLFPITFRLIQDHPQRCRIQKPYLGNETDGLPRRVQDLSLVKNRWRGGWGGGGEGEVWEGMWDQSC